MTELKMYRMKRDAGNAPLRLFFRMVLSVTDDRMPERRKLHADLVLQARHQRNADKRRAVERTFGGIPELGTRRLRVVRRGHFLKHPRPAKIVNEGSLPGLKMPANNRQILPHRRMAEKLMNQDIAVPLGLGKEHDPGGNPVNAMHDKSLLSLPLQFRRKKRPGGRRIRTFHRHSCQSRGLVDGHDCVVFIKENEFPGETGPPPVLLSRTMTTLMCWFLQSS